MVAMELNVLALALYLAAAVAFTRQNWFVLATCGALFVPAIAAATALAWWELSPLLAALVLATTVGFSLLTLGLYLVDRIWAPFCLEMTYPAMLLWVLWPVPVVFNVLGMLLGWASR